MKNNYRDQKYVAIDDNVVNQHKWLDSTHVDHP